MTAALVTGKVFGVLSLAAVGVATAALVVGVMVFTGAAGLHGLTGSSGTPGAAGANGSNGATGAQGAAGANGANGANGQNGSTATWGTLSLAFSLGGSATNGLTIQGATCPSEGHGAYACLVSISNSASSSVKVYGLSYAQSPALYYAGADPTIGAIDLTPGTTTQFTLWFQAVEYSGNADVDVTILVEPATTSS